MKLTKLHLFLIIIAVLVASTLGFSIKEYFENKEVDYNQALDKGSNYDPFGNNDMSQDSENNYDATIADLEDIVVPGRRERRHHHDSNGNHIPKHKHQDKHQDKHEHSRKKHDKNDDIMNPVQNNNSLANNTCNIDMSKYILKSEVVPPVCPKCPDSKSCPRQKPCAPCPPCARCPEPAFECKKVPNYNAISASNVNDVLPMPRLNSFAQFN